MRGQAGGSGSGSDERARRGGEFVVGKVGVSCRTPEAELICGLMMRSGYDPWDVAVGHP